MSSEEPRRRRTRKKRSFNTVVQMRNERSLVALLRDEPRFRWAVGGVLVLMVVLAVLVPKVWVTTPDGFFPVVKVSGLDLLQAASLRRSAASAGKAGDFPAAAQAWESAVANNPADVRSLRGLLDLLATRETPDPAWRLAANRRGAWLLGLTATNAADLERVAAVFEQYGQAEWITSHLAPRAGDLGPAGKALLGRAWFQRGDMAAFDAWWREHGAAVEAMPDMRLHRAAWQAGWGPAGEAGEGRARLEAAVADPALKRIALRLLLVVQARALDADGYSRTLSELAAIGSDRLSDRTRRWMLLRAAGRMDDARAAARAYSRSPSNELEAVELTSAWRALGLPELAAGFVTRGLDEYPELVPVWLNLAGTFADARRWDDLRVLAQRIRNSRGVDTALGGYAFFLEGLAEHGLDLRPRAEQSFDAMLENPPSDPVLTLHAALAMRARGYPAPAGRLLESLEKTLGDDPSYWMRVAENAFQTRDAETILYASRRAHELAPSDLALANNHAAALLVSRSRPADAVSLTVALLARYPTVPAVRLNHALALVLNARHEEGLLALGAIDVESLPAEQRSGWHLGRFEALQGLGRTAEAREAAARVDVRDLFGPQAEWFEAARARLAVP